MGFGNVGRRFCELVARKGDELAHDHGLHVRFAAVGTGSHGSLLAPRGLSAADVAASADSACGADWSFPDPARSGVELIAAAAAAGADTLVEATPLDPHGGGIAIAHIEVALRHGMDVITVNKGPIAWAYRRLADLAADRGRALRFEGTVMDGCPVFDLYWSCLPGCRVLGFDAVFNSTTNYILDAMGEGESFANALAQVQADGYAEADPSHDIDGHDAAAKTAALANVVMDARMTPDDIARDGIRDVAPERVREARDAGRRLRVVCSAVATDPTGQARQAASEQGERSPDSARVRAAVRLVELPPEHPLFSASGSTLSLLLHTDLMGTIQVAERDALPDQTAYAILADLLAIHQGR